MLIYYIAFLVLLVLSLINYHRTILAYASIRMFFHPGICLRYDSPAIQLDFACCVLFLCLYFFHKKGTFPKQLQIAYFVLLCSYIVSVLSSTYSFSQAAPPMIGKITLLLYSYLFFVNLKDLKDIRFFHIVFFLCMALMIGYGMFEYIIQENPVFNYQKDISPTGMEGMVYNDGNERLGSIRCQSFSAISISYGTYCIMWMCFVLIHYRYYKKLMNYPVVVLIAIFCIVGAFSSGSKSPFIFLLSYLCFYVLMAKGNKRFKILIISFTLTVGVIGSTFLYDFYLMIVDSSRSSTAGSDIPMRLMQMDAVGKLLDSHSWLCGLGARGVMKAQLLNSSVLGAESIWLQLVLEQGLLGCFAYIYMIYSIIKYSKKNISRDRFALLYVFIISWVLINTVTSLPGIDLSFFLCLSYVYILKEELEERVRKNKVTIVVNESKAVKGI